MTFLSLMTPGMRSMRFAFHEGKTHESWAFFWEGVFKSTCAFFLRLFCSINIRTPNVQKSERAQWGRFVFPTWNSGLVVGWPWGRAWGSAPYGNSSHVGSLSFVLPGEDSVNGSSSLPEHLLCAQCSHAGHLQGSGPSPCSRISQPGAGGRVTSSTRCLVRSRGNKDLTRDYRGCGIRECPPKPAVPARSLQSDLPTAGQTWTCQGGVLLGRIGARRRWVVKLVCEAGPARLGFRHWVKKGFRRR